MIVHVRGTLIEKQPTRAVIETNGIGYELLTPLSSYDRLPSRGSEAHLLTYEHIREDAHTLYGFITEEERHMFQLLIGVSGVGPKLAISALSGLTVRDLTAAVVEGDVKRLSSVSGIGKKGAERIIVELKHRLSDADALQALAGPPDDTGSTLLRDAVMALVALGYKQDEARRMVKQVSDKQDGLSSVEAVIKLALAR